jgi:tungstate transport system ATP-binding protein
MAKRSWRELSGGEAKRVALAARLIRNPPVLVLDEPTANLDDAGIAAVEAVIRQRSGRATTVLISHDLQKWAGALVEW